MYEQRDPVGSHLVSTATVREVMSSAFLMGRGRGQKKKAKPATEQLDLDNSEPQTPPNPPPHRQAVSLATGSIGISVFERRVKSERYSNQSLTFLE